MAQDVYCPVCGEEFFNDSIHSHAAAIGSTYREVARSFRVSGCEALGETHGPGQAPPGVGVMYELMGDDMDGAIAEFEDMRDMIWERP